MVENGTGIHVEWSLRERVHCSLVALCKLKSAQHVGFDIADYAAMDQWTQNDQDGDFKTNHFDTFGELGCSSFDLLSDTFKFLSKVLWWSLVNTGFPSNRYFSAFTFPLFLSLSQRNKQAHTHTISLCHPHTYTHTLSLSHPHAPLTLPLQPGRLLLQSKKELQLTRNLDLKMPPGKGNRKLTLKP